MKNRKIALTLAAALVMLTFFPGMAANGQVLSKKFSNCAALNAVYRGGVAKNSKVQNQGGATKYTPTVNAKVYSENASKDRDKDGIACER